MISERLSDKFRICSFIATIFVVYRHSFVIQAFYGASTCSSEALTLLNKWVANMTEVAVPMFFLTSGYFFLGRRYDTLEKYRGMLCKKIRTLLIPFLFWNLMGLLVLLATKKCNMQVDGLSFVKNFFVSKYYGPLWYVRDLMIFMLAVPLYQWIYDKKMKWALCGLLVAFLLSWIPVDCSVVSSEGLLFFAFGGALRKSNVLEQQLKSRWSIVCLLVVWVVSCLLLDFWRYEWLHKFLYFLGLTAVWYGIDLFSPKMVAYVKTFSSYAFFIYVTHFYSIKAVKMSLAYLFHTNEYMAIFTFLVIPLLVVSCLFFIGIKLKHFCPKFYAVVTGNR